MRWWDGGLFQNPAPWQFTPTGNWGWNGGGITLGNLTSGASYYITTQVDANAGNSTGWYVQGSTFTVWIPLDDRQVNRPVERAPITPAR